LLFINFLNPAKVFCMFLLFVLGLLFTNCNNKIADANIENEIELALIKKGSLLLEKGEYNEAKMVYSQLIEKYHDHPYVDDAAYRLAYICVIADDLNPYFDYENAAILFQNFIENYPNSRYIVACKNWLNLLKAVGHNHEKPSVSSINRQQILLELSQLRNELKRVQADNIRLRNTLDDLQKAIER
jgi:outer membrane protein assembly factor BamD (BamD/ComL family)